MSAEVAIRPTEQPTPGRAPLRERSAAAAAERVIAEDGRVNILLVDDQPENLRALEAVLECPQYRLVRASSGEQALKALLREDFALILLDVMMPGMDGIETAELIRRRDRTRYTPIVFITAVGRDEDYVARGYSAGAVDYLFKPIVPDILRSKVAGFVELFRKGEEIKRQERRLREMERREHAAKLAEAERRIEAERLQTEMDVARQIQQQLFPAAAPQSPGFDIAGASYPVGPAGGDYFDYIRNSDRFLDVVVGDVAGHGLGPALLMSATRAYLRVLAPRNPDVGEVLASVNRALTGDTAADQFVTLVLARLDLEQRRLVYASAGHSSGYLLDGSGAVKAELESTGMPLAILADSEFETSPEVALAPGDLAFFYTDGVVEATNLDGEQFGIRRALEVVGGRCSQPAIDVVRALHEAVLAFIGTGVPHDDMTAVIIRT